jgi:hypothetical protein
LRFLDIPDLGRLEISGIIMKLQSIYP